METEIPTNPLTYPGEPQFEGVSLAPFNETGMVEVEHFNFTVNHRWSEEYSGTNMWSGYE